jgi:hypothetical protein
MSAWSIIVALNVFWGFWRLVNLRIENIPQSGCYRLVLSTIDVRTSNNIYFACMARNRLQTCNVHRAFFIYLSMAFQCALSVASDSRQTDMTSRLALRDCSRRSMLEGTMTTSRTIFIIVVGQLQMRDKQRSELQTIQDNKKSYKT